MTECDLCGDGSTNSDMAVCAARARMQVGMRSSIIVLLALLLGSVFAVGVESYPVQAIGGTIYIRADGSIDPPTTSIETFDNITYTFTDNINDSIVVERNDIVVEGAGFTVQGDGNGTGFILQYNVNVTIKNACMLAPFVNSSLEPKQPHFICSMSSV